MVHESSAGIILFRRMEEIQFLYLMKKDGYLDFSKGHIERGENKKEAALRETEEETGIKCKIIAGFEEKTDYYFYFDKNNIHKDLTLFLGEVDRDVKVKTSNEHEAYVWLNYEDSMKYLKFDNQKNIIKKAYEFINEKVPK
ncbi:MAG: bis(5'-nucleosyl)-tetraphosphatase [Cuniculiplasma sp.]